MNSIEQETSPMDITEDSETSETLNKYMELIELIKKSKKKEAQELISNGATVNQPNLRIFANTPLHWAVIKFSDTELIEALLAKNADILALNGKYQTPIHVAAELNRIEAVKLFWKLEVHHLIPQLETLINIALTKGNQEIAKFFIDFTVDNKIRVNLKDFLFPVVQRGLTEIVQLIAPYWHGEILANKKIPYEIANTKKYEVLWCINFLVEQGFTIIRFIQTSDATVFALLEHGFKAAFLDLLDEKMAVDRQNRETGLTLFQTACLKRYFDIAETLVKHKADVNADAIMSKAISYYLAPNCPNYHCNQRLNFFAIAVKKCDGDLVKFLLAHGVRFENGPAIHDIIKVGVKNDCQDIFKSLINRRFGPNTKFQNQETMLHLICTPCNYSCKISGSLCKKPEIVRYLIQCGADVNAETVSGATPLFYAIYHGFVSVVKILLEHGANVRHVDSEGLTTIHVACDNSFLKNDGDSVEIVKRLLNSGANMNAVDNNGNPPLYYAIKDANLSMIEFLLQNNAVTDYPLIHMAIDAVNNMNYQTFKEITEVFIKYNVDIDAVDQEGRSALHICCRRGFHVKVKVLLEHNANVNRVDPQGLTPIFYACENLNKKEIVIEHLLDHNADTRHITNDGQTILHHIERKASMYHQHEDIIELIINQNIDLLPVRDKQGRSALHLAMQGAKSYNYLKILMKYGADINLLDNDNHDPIYYATEVLSEAHKKLKEASRIRDERQKHTRIRHSVVVDYDNAQMEWQNVSRFANEVLKYVSEYMIKKEFLGLSVDFKSFDLLLKRVREYNCDLSEYYAEFDGTKVRSKCKKEMKNLKSEKIGNSQVTFYKFLTQSDAFATKYANNEEFLAELKSEFYEEMFPMFIGMVKYRFAEGVARSKLMKSMPLFSRSNIFHKLPDECMELVADNLDRSELESFISAMRG